MRALRDPWLAAAVAVAVPAVALIAAAGVPPPVLPVAAFDKVWWPAQAWWIVSAVLLFPLLEETVFRGLLQASLLTRGWRAGFAGFTTANLSASLVFAALHGVLSGSLLACLVFFPSLLFGWFFERHGGLAVPVFLHGFYNAAWLSRALLPG